MLANAIDCDQYTEVVECAIMPLQLQSKWAGCTRINHLNYGASCTISETSILKR
jgi:hypothetical protein